MRSSRSPRSKAKASIPPDVDSIDDLGGYADSGHAITVHTLSSGDEGNKERYVNGDLVTSHAYYVTGIT